MLGARRAGVKRLVVCLPTGAGKTVIFSHLAAQARRQVLVLAHREELLQQARDKLEGALRRLGKGGTVEVEQGPRRASAAAKVAVCSIRSLRPERLGRMMQGRDVGLIIYDECHHAAAADNRRVLEQIGCFEPDWPGTLLGFTATTQRGDGQGLDEVFEEIVYTRTIGQMIRDGYLSRLRGYRVATAADLRRVGVSGEDFNVEALAEAVDVRERNALVARSIQELARDRRTLVFCVNVAHARNLARALNAIGLPTGMVHGEMKREQRGFVLDNFRAGRLQALTNVMVLTEGFDDPGVSCVAMARPTRSSGLYTQCVGRGTRLAEGKDDCLVLDFVDLSSVTLTTLPSLFGLPRDLQLDGAEVEEAGEALGRLFERYPQLEVDPGEITLAEIQRRAASFDPLTLEVDPEVRAISANAWVSLGRTGLALHVERGRRLRELLVLRVHEGGRARYQVVVDGEEVARFSRISEAVEAVDYEVARMGPAAARSALPEAAWRAAPVDAETARRLRALRPPRAARTMGEAVHHLTHARRAPRRGPGLFDALS